MLHLDIAINLTFSHSFPDRWQRLNRWYIFHKNELTPCIFSFIFNVPFGVSSHHNNLTYRPYSRPLSPSGEPKKSLSSDNLSVASSDSGRKFPPPGCRGDDEGESLYVPEVEEMRVSPVVSRKGYLNFLEEKTSGWLKRWVVSAQHIPVQCLYTIR